MRFRFLYLGPSGSQTEVASLDDLRELIETGTVLETTPLFDALTQQWAPARAHSVYRLLCDESRLAGGSPASADVAAEDLPDLGLTVTKAAAASSDTDQAVRQLMKENEREGDGAPRRAESWANPVGWSARPAPPEPVPPGRAPASPAASVRDPRRPDPAPARRVAAPVSAAPHAPARAVLAEPQRSERGSFLATPVPFDRLRGWGRRAIEAIARLAEHRRAPAMLVSAGMVGLLLVLITAVRGGSPARAEGTAVRLNAPGVRGLVGRFALAEDSGFRHMVAGIDSLRRQYHVVEVPAAWLEGRYLADATRYPEVPEYWQRYRAFLDAVQASDSALYRAGFAAQLRDEGVEGPVLSLRLNQAMSGFEQTQPSRSSMYLHMEELAAASLALHELLVEREADITYEPALDRRLSRDPVVEALPLDTLLRDRMWVLLDRIFASLEMLGGDLGANRDNLTETLLQEVEASQH